jgi:hypothetical protein
MPENVIGLLFEIAGDPRKAEEAMAHLNAASVAESAEISSVWSSAMEVLTGPTGIALGGITALGGAMFEAANKAAEAGNQIFEASEKTGLSAEHLSAISALAKETGGSFDALTVALSRASVNLQNALVEPGAMTAKVLANVMGGAQNLAELGLKPMDERLQTVLHRIFELNDAGERNQALQALMGRGWQQNVEVLELLAKEGYAPAIEQAKKFGIFYDEGAARRAHEYRVQMNSLTAELSGLGLKIGNLLVPGLARWIAELHTVNYEVQLLEVGLKAQALSLINVGGIFDKQLDKLAQRATDLVDQEHQALAVYQKQIEDIGKALSQAGEGRSLPEERQAKATKEHAEAAKQLAAVLPPVIQAEMQIEKSRADEAIRKQALAILDLDKNLRGPALELPAMNRELAASSELFQQIPPYAEAAAEATNKFADAMHAAARAMQSDAANSVQLVSQGIAGLIGGRKAQAAVEAVWETARGIACLAEGTWPPNPAAIIAAGLHFESAAQFAVLAGKSAGAHRGAGGGGAQPGYSRSGESSRSSGGELAAPPQTLAAGANGRFGSPGSGIIVVHGSADLHQFVAGLVNGAVQRGITVTATSSQRGAPVGH